MWLTDSLNTMIGAMFWDVIQKLSWWAKLLSRYIYVGLTLVQRLVLAGINLET